MSLSILPNQALGAKTTNTESCGGLYLQPIQRGDKYSLQGFSNMNSGEDRSNGQFFDTRWTLGDGWTAISSSLLEYEGPQPMPTSALSPLMGLQTGRLYKFRIGVEMIDNGGAMEFDGVVVYINDNPVKLPNAPLGYGEISSFSLWAYYVPTSIGSDRIAISFNHTGMKFRIGQVQLLEMSHPMIVAYDTGGNEMQEITPDFVHYFTGNPAGQNLPARFETRFGIDALPDGCYTLKIKEGNGNVLNGNFANALNWTLEAPWTITGGQLRFNGATANQDAETRIQLRRNVDYRLRFFVEGGSGFTATLLFADGSSTTQAFSGTGWKEWDFNETYTGTNQAVTLRFRPNNSAFSESIIISRLSIQRSEVYFEAEPVELKTQHPSTLLFAATNNDGAFGFDYSNELNHTLRLKAKMDVTSYPEAAETYIYSDNSEVLLFGRTQKEHTVYITDAPVYIHDCLRHLRLHDTFTVNNHLFVREGAYELNRRKSSALKQASFTLKEKESIESNYRLL